MRSSLALRAAIGIAVLAVAVSSRSEGLDPSASLNQLADLAIGTDPSVAQEAIAKLRAAGPDGLAMLMSRLPEQPVAQRELSPVDGQLSDTRHKRLEAAIDAVAAQKDAWAAGLYWYADFDQALAVAGRTKRPIIALHLLGNLTDELSCANSRFFRTALYPDPKVGAILRDRYVLYWKSVRPVPKITIDFGDGRKIERTITGNSIHYVLDCRGRIVDALPGMYGPRAFAGRLTELHELAATVGKVDDSTCQEALAAFHTRRAEELTERLRSKLKLAGLAPSDPIVAELLSNSLSAQDAALEDVSLWEQLAALQTVPERLDRASVRVMARKPLPAGLAGKLAMSKRVVEDPLLRVVADFEQTMAADSLLNEYVLHRIVHRWLAIEPATANTPLTDFNARVYEYLFLSPLDDPWAGLASASYDAIGE